MAQVTFRPVPAFLPVFMMKAEAKRYVAYPDGGGVWTIGIGHTGPEVHAGMVITDSVIQAYLAEDLNIAVAKLYKVLSPAAIMRLSENQWGALISFAFNLGAKASWGIWAVIESGNLASVPAKISLFDKIGHEDPKTGKVVYEVSEGLVHRRAAEVAMWNTPDPVDPAKLQNVPPPATAVIEAAPATVVMPSSAMVRMADTPPALPRKNGVKAIVTGLGAGLASAPAWIKEVVDTLQQWNSGSDYVTKAIGILMTVGAVLAVASLIYSQLNHKDERA